VPGTPAVGSAVADPWSEPARYGTDGIGLEVIYASTNLEMLPDAKKPKNTWGFDKPGVAGGLPWHDGANISPTQALLSLANPILYRSQRRIYGVPEVGATIPAEWTEPRIVNRYGVPGFDGSDGNGTEDIFAVGPWEEAAFPKGLLPKNTWGFNDGGTAGPVEIDDEEVSLVWTDGGQSLTEEDRYLYRCRRQVPGTPANGTNRPSATEVPPSNVLPGTDFALPYRYPVQTTPGNPGRYSFKPTTGNYSAVPTWNQIKAASRFAYRLDDAGGKNRSDKHMLLGDGSVFVFYVDEGQWVAWNVDAVTTTSSGAIGWLTFGARIGFVEPGTPAAPGADVGVELRFRPADDAGWSDWGPPKIVGVWGNRGLDGKPGFGGKNVSIVYNTLAVPPESYAKFGDFGHWLATRPTSPDDDTALPLPTEDNWDETLQTTYLYLNYRDKDNVDQSDALRAMSINDIVAIYVDEEQWVDLRVLGITQSTHSVAFEVRLLEDITPDAPASLPEDGDVTFMLSRAPTIEGISSDATYNEHRFRVEKRARIPLKNDPVPAQPAAGATVALTADAGRPYTAGVGEFLLVSGSARGGRPPYRYSWQQAGEAAWFKQFGNGQRARYRFAKATRASVRLTVTDAAGKTATDDVVIEITAATVQYEVSIAGPDRMTVGARAWFATTERGTHTFRGEDTWAWSVEDTDNPANGRAVTGTATHGASFHVQAVSAGQFNVVAKVTRGTVSRTVRKTITVVAAPAVTPPAKDTVHPYFYAGDAVGAPESTCELRWLRGERVLADRLIDVRIKPGNPERIEVADVLDPDPDDDSVGLYWEADGVTGAQEGTAITLTAIHKNSGVRQVVRWLIETFETSSNKGEWRTGVEYKQFFGPVAKVEGYTEDARVESDGRVQQGDIVLMPWDVPMPAAIQEGLRRPYIPTLIRFQARTDHLSTVDNKPVIDAAGPKQSADWNPVFLSDTAPQLPTDIGPYKVPVLRPVNLVLAEAVGGNPPLTYALRSVAGTSDKPELPDWMSFDATTSAIGGTPPGVAAPVTLVYTVSDADVDGDGDPAPQTDEHTFTLEVVAEAVYTILQPVVEVPIRAVGDNIKEAEQFEPNPAFATLTVLDGENGTTVEVEVEGAVTATGVTATLGGDYFRHFEVVT